MNPEVSHSSANTQMVESIIQLIRSLPPAERQFLEKRLVEELPELLIQSLPLAERKLFKKRLVKELRELSIPELSIPELMQLCNEGGSFDFWHDEPDIYTIKDGEAIEW